MRMKKGTSKYTWRIKRSLSKMMRTKMMKKMMTTICTEITMTRSTMDRKRVKILKNEKTKMKERARERLNPIRIN